MSLKCLGGTALAIIDAKTVDQHRRHTAGGLIRASLYLCRRRHARRHPGRWSAQAITIDLKVVDTFARSSPFGLAYDGTNIWWGDSSSTLHQMTTSGVDTGVTTTNPAGWSAISWDGSHLLGASGSSIFKFNRDTGAIDSTISSPFPDGLIDGLGYGGGRIYWSPDVGPIYSLKPDGSDVKNVTPTSGGGGFSGVEPVTVGSDSFMIVVNDAFSPRKLCAESLDGTTEIGCAQLLNSRYEDLAFDGRYIYAADYYGGKIDKIDLLVDGGSIFVPPTDTPEPATLAVLGTALVGFAATRRRA